jgi:MFS family permease
MPSDPARHDPYAALRIAGFRFYLSGNLLAIIGVQMQTAAVGWEIYHRTGSKFLIGLVGLVEVLPVIALALLTGHVADRFDRKTIVRTTLTMVALSSLALATISFTQGPIWAMYVLLFVIGVARAFQQPAKSALLVQVVSPENFASAVTWSTGAFQLACIVGPALGGVLIWLTHRPALVYLLDTTAASIFVTMLTFVPVLQAHEPSREPVTFHTLSAGIRYVWSNKVVLGAMALDMFAVLLGGATALLPVYAEDILGVGAIGFGVLRAAPAVGAVLMAGALVFLPPMQRAGRSLLWAIAGFGLATIVFGVSTSFPLSLAMLFLTGALDQISVVIRHTLVQLQTPDEMRGRVSAINGMFIGASNELGAFESGTVAELTSPAMSVVSGGIGTILVVAASAVLLPQLRRYGRLQTLDPQLQTAPILPEAPLDDPMTGVTAYPSTVPAAAASAGNGDGLNDLLRSPGVTR